MPLPVQPPLPLPPTEAPGRVRTLADRCCALIERRGRPLEVGQIVSQVLRVTGAPERLQRRLVAEIVDADPRLGWRSRDLVGLTTPAWSSDLLESASFCVVDLETTGGRPGKARILEIGAVRVSGLAITDRFSQLVDPETPIPEIIDSLTGIDARAVAGMPRIAEALPRFIEFCGDDVLIAHNASFDLRFLNHARHRLGEGYFVQPSLDTLALARRLLRGRTARFDLGTLASWAMTTVRPCHRALPDAEATAELFIMLAHMLLERGEHTVAAALRYARPSANRNAHKLVLAEGLPAGPGVYSMRARDGRLLYVGKAANLRRRVRAYFGPSGAHSRAVARVLDRLGQIDHESCGSEFEAALREARMIAELRPPGNRRGVAQDARRYLKIGTAEPFPRAYVVARPSDDGALYLGPLLSDRGARLAVEALQRITCLRTCHPMCAPDGPAQPGCGGPCAGTRPEDYAERVARAARVASGDVEGLSILTAELREAVVDGRLDPHAEDAERVEALLAAVARIARLRRAAAVDGVLVEPNVSGGPPTVFAIRAGLVCAQASGGDRAAIRSAVATIREPAGVPPLGAVEESSIVREHLARRAGSPGALLLSGEWDLDATVHAVERTVRTLSVELFPEAA